MTFNLNRLCLFVEEKVGVKLRLKTLLVLPLLLLTTRAWCLDPSVAIRQYGHQSWRQQDGLFNGTPTAIVQAPDGVIWLGTSAGLYRFDGIRFIPWKTKSPEIPDDFPVFSIVAAADGTLYAGSEGAFYIIRKNTAQRFVMKGRVTSVTQDASGKIWFSRWGGTAALCRVEEPQPKCFDKADGISHGGATSLASTPDGRLWYGDNYLASWKDGKEATAVPVLTRSGHVDFRQFISLLSHGGSLWAAIYGEGLDGGLARIEEGRVTDIPITLNGKRVSHMANVRFDAQGNLWAGSDSDGLFRMSGGMLAHYGTSDGLSGDSVTALMEDREHQMWAVTDRGVDVFRDLPVITYSRKEGVVGAVSSLAVSSDGSVLIGEAGALQKFKDGKLTTLIEGTKLPGTNVTSMLEDRQGTLWLGIGSGLYTYERGKLTEIRDSAGQPLGDANAMVEDGEGTVWALFAGRNPADPDKLDFKTVYFKGKIPVRLSIKEDVAMFLMSPRKQGVWAVSSKGDIYSIQQEAVARVSAGPHSATTSAMLSDGFDGMLKPISSGLMHWDGKVLSMLSRSNGLPCDMLSAAVFDRAGNLWMEASCGLIAVTKDSLFSWYKNPQSHVNTKLFTGVDGFAVGDVNWYSHPMVLDGGGRILMVGTAYLGMVAPEALQSSGVAPLVYAGDLIADGKQYELQPELRLNPRTRDISIRYSSTAYVHPELTTFRYRLDGYDTDWQQAGNRREAVYTNLPPGTYTFHVAATTASGATSVQDQTVQFTIPPAFFQTIWFRVLLVGLLLGLVWLFFYMKLRSRTAQIQARMYARLDERERIARDLHDTLLQSLQGLVLTFQLAADQLPSDSTARPRINDALDQSDKIIEEGRNQVKSLRGVFTASSDFPSVLQTLSQELQVLRPIPCSLTVSGHIRAVRAAAQRELHQVAREALSNAFRHSRATTITITIDFGARLMHLVVRDDGVGIPSDVLLAGGRVNHYGFAGIRERVRLLRGDVRFDNHADGGCEVQISVPAKEVYERRSQWRAVLDHLKLQQEQPHPKN